MTPFGVRLRDLRRTHRQSMRQLAVAVQVSPAYLSALEHGRRGVPQPGLVRQICDHFGLIWDEADALLALAAASDPRVVVETGGLSPEHTRLANRLAQTIGTLGPTTVAELHALLDHMAGEES